MKHKIMKRIFILYNIVALTGSLLLASAASLPLKDRVQTNNGLETVDNMYQKRVSYSEIQQE